MKGGHFHAQGGQEDKISERRTCPPVLPVSGNPIFHISGCREKTDGPTAIQQKKSQGFVITGKKLPELSSLTLSSSSSHHIIYPLFFFVGIRADNVGVCGFHFIHFFPKRKNNTLFLRRTHSDVVDVSQPASQWVLCLMLKNRCLVEKSNYHSPHTTHIERVSFFLACFFLLGIRMERNRKK